MNKVKLNTATAGAPAGAELEVIERNTNSMVLRTDNGTQIVVPLSHIDDIPDAQKSEDYEEGRKAGEKFKQHVLGQLTEAGKAAFERGDLSTNQMVEEPPFAETPDSQPIWDEKANVFVNADGTIAQPQTDDERKRLGLPSVEEEFHAMSPEDQANAHITGNETTEELEARGFTLESDIEQEMEAEEDEILAAKDYAQEPELSVVRAKGYNPEGDYYEVTVTGRDPVMVCVRELNRIAKLPDGMEQERVLGFKTKDILAAINNLPDQTEDFESEPLGFEDETQVSEEPKSDPQPKKNKKGGKK